MKNKKTMMVLALVIVSAITMTAWGVQASGNKIGQYTKTIAENMVKNELQKKIDNCTILGNGFTGGISVCLFTGLADGWP